MAEYKYNAQIDALLKEGCVMPTLQKPNNKEAFRFVFAQHPERNHLPVCVSNPRRILPGPMKLSGYALSCFGDYGKGKQRYISLMQSFKRIALTVGDSLAFGNLRNEDGLITDEETSSHFDLYEFAGCNLNNAFIIKERLV